MKLFDIYEDKFSAACCICFNDSYDILLGISTADDDRNGKWCFPGGGIKAGEPPEKAAERECKEETNIKCYSVSNAKQLPHKKGVAFVVCRTTGGIIRPNNEFSKLKWFDPSDAMNLSELYMPNKKVLRSL